MKLRVISYEPDGLANLAEAGHRYTYDAKTDTAREINRFPGDTGCEVTGIMKTRIVDCYNWHRQRG